MPAVWVGSTLYDIAESLSEVILRTCPHLDLIYIFVKQIPQEKSLELVRTNQTLITGDEAQRIGKAFSSWLSVGNSKQLLNVPHPLGDGSLDIAVVPIGHSGTFGFIVAGVPSSHVLTDLDRLTISVAANQAATALQQAQLVNDLREANQLQSVSFAKEQSARKQIASLQLITAALSQVMTREQIAWVVIDQVVNTLKAERGVFHLLDASDNTLIVRYRIGEPIINNTMAGGQRYTLEPSSSVAEVINSQTGLWIEST